MTQTGVAAAGQCGFGLLVRFIEDNRLAMRRKDGTFEEDIDCIVQPTRGAGGIFISNLQAAQNSATLHRLSIGAVITAARGQNLASSLPKHIEYLYLPAVDHESFDISQYFDAACGLLSDELRRTNVLVHCMAGVSRSATLVIAFLMRSQALSFSQAYSLVKRKRKIISPNSAFIQQLQQEEQRLKTRLPSPNKRPLEQSTSSSWFSGPKGGREEAGGGGEDAYERQLRQRIRVLFAGRTK